MMRDEGALSELLEESRDVHADAMRSAHDAGAQLVRSAPSAPPTRTTISKRILRSPTRTGVRSARASAAPRCSALPAAAHWSPCWPPTRLASSKPDVQILQTAASIETLAVATYKTALTLPYIGGSSANGVVKAFAEATMSQHAQHKAAFNAAVKRLGGKAQTKPDPAFVPVVNKAVASLSNATAAQGALGVVGLAIELENVAAETYVNDVANLKDHQSKALTASIMGVEAQHVAVLLAVQALLKANAPQLIALSPTNVTYLPAAAGSVGFPNPFYKTNQAAPKSQGAVK